MDLALLLFKEISKGKTLFGWMDVSTCVQRNFNGCPSTLPLWNKKWTERFQSNLCLCICLTALGLALLPCRVPPHPKVLKLNSAHSQICSNIPNESKVKKAKKTNRDRFLGLLEQKSVSSHWYLIKWKLWHAPQIPRALFTRSNISRAETRKIK